METITIEPELVSLKSKLSAKIESAAKQIEFLKREMTANEAMLQSVKRSLGLLHPESKQTGYGSKRETIRDAIKSIHKSKFTQTDVEEAIKQLNPDMPINRNRLRSALWNMQRRKDLIRQVTPGNNRQVAVYEKLPSSNNALNGLSSGNEAMRRSISISTNSGVLTVGQLEDLVREKNRRLPDIATHFNVDKATVLKFFEPASKVYIGEKGWIKIRE